MTLRNPSKKLRLFILGGCAKMAVPALKALVREEEVSEVVLGDRDTKKASELAMELGAKFVPRGVNALNHGELVEAVRGYDAVLGYVGPFYLFEEKIARACIEARVPYVSIADDFDAFLSVVALHEEAKAAGVPILTGLGNSPGLTNLLAKKGYLSMDAPKKIHVQWTGGSDEEVGPANVLHVMHIFEGETIQWLDGRETRVKTGRGEKVVEFPEPIGVQTVFYTGHAESVSIPRYLKGLDEVTLHGGVRPVWVAKLARTFGDLRLTTSHSRRQRLANMMAPIMNVFSMGDTANRSVFRIDVYGTHQGQERHHFYTGVGPIAEITSYPLLEGALMLARKELTEPGVFAPEGILDPDDFLPRVARRGVRFMFYENV